MAKFHSTQSFLSPQRSFRLFLNKGRTRSRLRCLIVAGFIVYYLFVLYHWMLRNTPAPTAPVQCDSPTGLEDVLVMVKTGARDVRAKLPVQLQIGLQCLPSYAIFSDLEEEVFGEHVYDALSGVSAETKLSNPDFEIYKKLQAGGPRDFDGSAFHPRQHGRSHGKGWVLDKWKFLPILQKAWKIRPDAKWFLMMELDTYVVWSNLVQFLAQFDHRESHYLGSTMAIGMQEFAHGGGGILISNEAIKRFMEHYSAHQAELEDFVAGQWAGDYVLGKAMSDAGVKHKGSWPLQQIHSVSGINYARVEPRRIWCAPALTYHLMSSDEMMSMQMFERQWKAANISNVLRHRDVFEYNILPQINLRKTQWDNFAGEDMVADRLSEMTKEKCFLACREIAECKQYSVENGLCRMSKTVHLGGPVLDERREVTSGWMRDRILHYFHHRIEPCAGDDQEPFKI